MQLLKELAINSKYSNYEIKLKTAFGRLNHMPLSRVLTGFIKEVHSFQPNRQRGPWR